LPSSSIIAVLCLLLCGPGTPENAGWSTIGPGGGGWHTTLTIVNDPKHTLYAGVDVGGIYKSSDHGLNWTLKNNGLSTYYVEDIAYDPSAPSQLYAATRGGIFKSVNGGDSWVSKRDGFPAEQEFNFSAPVSDILVDPNHPDIIYAGIGVPRAGYQLDSYYWQTAGIKGAIYKSIDAGEHWSLIRNTGIDPTAMIYSLAIDTSHSNILYAATSTGIYKSTSAGATWSARNTGLPGNRTMQIRVNPDNSDILYTTLWAEPGSLSWNGGVYKSIDGSDNWLAKNTGLEQTMGAIEGLTSNYPALVIDSSHPDTLYVGNNAWDPRPGVFKTTDGGEHWAWVSRAEPPEQNLDPGWIYQHSVAVKTMAIDPADPAQLYFGTSTKLLKTVDSGNNWVQTYSNQRGENTWQGHGLETTVVQEIVVDPKNPSRIYAGYWDMGFLKSTDGGISFKRTFENMEYSSNTFSIIIDPADSSIIYAATGWWEENKGQVVKSTDFGDTWTALKQGLPDATIWSMAMDGSSPENARILYAASYDNGIYKSIDGGQNWFAVNAGLGVGGNLQLRKIQIDPSNPTTLYAGIEAKLIESENTSSTLQGGLFKSTNGGANWLRIDGSMPQLSVWDIEVDPDDSDIIYTAVSSEYDHSLEQEFFGGVYKSSDGGQSWAKKNTGFGSDSNLNISAITINPANHAIIYATSTDSPFHDNSSGRGIFKSSDAGSHWESISDASKILDFSAITVDPSHPTRLYAGSGGNGILKYTDSSASP